MKTSLLISIGIVLTIAGFSSVLYSSYIMLPPTEPPTMQSIEGTDYVFFMHKQAFLFSGIIGIFVTVTGTIFWRKRK